ncbi:DUF6703 family protein [Cryptosporangium sp. NPDC048952]|uniref:DUF6703 family protein n=1 Tax=Cryptosporangium sp. NPDC048952 TaxID=3363961 RepID=UPI00371B85D9
MPELGSRSTNLLTFLLRVPRLVLVLGVVALLLAGAFLPGVLGAVFLVLVAALLGWFARLNWDPSTPGARTARLVAIVVLLAFAVSKL